MFVWTSGRVYCVLVAACFEHKSGAPSRSRQEQEHKLSVMSSKRSRSEGREEGGEQPDQTRQQRGRPDATDVQPHCALPAAACGTYTADEMAEALWQLLPSKLFDGADRFRPALVEALRGVAEVNAAAASIPRWFVEGQTWDDAAMNVLYGAACWLYGAGPDVSKSLLQSFIRKASSEPCPESRDALVAFRERFDFQPTRIRLPILTVDQQLSALKKLYLASEGVSQKAENQSATARRCLSTFPFSPVECFQGCSWADAAERVLVALSWQREHCNTNYPLVAEFRRAFSITAVGFVWNNGVLQLFLKDFMLVSRLNVGSVVRRSLDDIVKETGYTLGVTTPTVVEAVERVKPEANATGSQSKPKEVVTTAELKFLTSPDNLATLRNRTRVVTTKVHLNASVVGELKTFWTSSEIQSLILCGEAGCGKTLLGLAAASFLGNCVYVCSPKVPKPLTSNPEERDEACAACVLMMLKGIVGIVSKQSERPLLIVIDEVGRETEECNGFTSMNLDAIKAAMMVDEVKVILVGTGSEASAIGKGSQPGRQHVFEVPARAGGDAVLRRIATEFPMVHRLLQQPRFAWTLRVMGNGRVAAGVCRYLRNVLTFTSNEILRSSFDESDNARLDRALGISNELFSALVSQVMPSTAVEAVLQSAVAQSLWEFKSVGGLSDIHVNKMFSLFCTAFALAAGDSSQRLSTSEERELLSTYGILTDTARYIPRELWFGSASAATAEAAPVAGGLDGLVRITGDVEDPTGFVLVARADHRYKMSGACCEMGLSLLGVQARPWTGEGCELLADYVLVSTLAAHSGVGISALADTKPHSMAAFGAACRAFVRAEGTSAAPQVVTVRDFRMARDGAVADDVAHHVAEFIASRIAALQRATNHTEIAASDGSAPTVCIAVNQPLMHFADFVVWRSWDKRLMCVQVKRYLGEPLTVPEALCELFKMGCTCFATAAAWVLLHKAELVVSEEAWEPLADDPSRALAAAAMALLRTAHREVAARKAAKDSDAQLAGTAKAPVPRGKKAQGRKSSAQKKKARNDANVSEPTKEEQLKAAVSAWLRTRPAAACASDRPPAEQGTLPVFVIAVISEKPETQLEHLERAFAYLTAEGVRGTAQYYVMEASDTSALAPVPVPVQAAHSEGDAFLDGQTMLYSTKMLPHVKAAAGIRK